MQLTKAVRTADVDILALSWVLKHWINLSGTDVENLLHHWDKAPISCTSVNSWLPAANHNQNQNQSKYFYLLRQGGYVFAVFLSVCLSVSKITQKVMDGSFWSFEGMSEMAQTTSDSILGVIRQESWILDHFEIFVC